MTRDRAQRSTFTAIAFALLALIVGLVVWTGRLLGQGNEAMEESDRAFHAGNLTEAVRSAESALGAYVPGAAHVRRAEDRLRAIARGSEADGKLMTARIAWDGLRVYDERTEYPGRGPTRYKAEAEAALIRIDRLLGEKVGGSLTPR